MASFKPKGCSILQSTNEDNTRAHGQLSMHVNVSIGLLESALRKKFIQEVGIVHN